ncbi:histone-lysine N-methyltransferase SETMAR [Trichonephila clavipes]|nr:histone-lysine N-methyltransferase SETMAR [Trichonephila clavipes]
MTRGEYFPPLQSRCRNCGGGDRGRVAIFRPFGELRRAKIVLSPVWCSRPTTGVPLAHATMNFVGLDLTASDRQAAEIVHGVYGADTVTVNYVQFWFRRIRSGIFDVKGAPRTGRPVDKVPEIIEVYRHVSSPSIAQMLKIDYKTILSHLSKVEIQKRSSMFGCHTN